MRINDDDARERIECFCGEHPLLAKAGVDASGKRFIRIRVGKVVGGRALSDVIVTEGVVRLQCRACGRWHVVVIPLDPAKLKLRLVGD